MLVHWRSRLRSLCELAVGAVVLGILLHTFVAIGVVAPVYVSAGSMAPHLLGPHWDADCAACGGRYAVGADAPPQAGRTGCPSCNEIVFLDNRFLDPGDKLYVDRVTYAFRPPRRWEPLVFRCPHEARSLCVKRVIGLPGEAIQFDRGDLLIDGKLQRKSFAEQTVLRILVHRERASAKWWRPRRDDTAWRWTDDAWEIREKDERPAEHALDWLEFVPLHEHVTDRTAYNAGVVAVENPTGDLMLSLRVACNRPGVRRDDIWGDSERLWIDCGPAPGGPDGGGRLLVTVSPRQRAAWIGPSPHFRPDEPRIAPGRGSDEPLEVTVSLFDRQLLVALDGVEMLRHPLDGPAPASERPFAVAVAGLDVELHDLAVWRDIVYTDGPAGPVRPAAESARWQIGTGEYFVLGDNPTISHDSRTWRHGPGLRAELIVGRPFGVR